MAKHKQNLRVSIVIPVYNEAATIADCLEAIAQQTVKPFEVIVVDNNSSDETVKIAESYYFVKVIHEPRQGVVYARDAGFSYAHGDIIGRIDADTVIAENWVETLKEIFACSSIHGVSGSVSYHDVALARVANWFDQTLRRYLAHRLGRYLGMQGANMAIRRCVWRAVKQEVCNAKDMHEDLDLSIHCAEMGFRNVYDERLVASLSFRQAGSSFIGFAQYVMLNPHTYARHYLKIRRQMYPVVALAILSFLPIKIVYKGFDPATQRFSMYKLLEVPEGRRVNPATFVD